MRQKRIDRWNMQFVTEAGSTEYLRQLANIRPGAGAILAIPQPPDYSVHSCLVIRNLNQRPATGDVEDIAKLHRIFWVDDNPTSVAGVARTLGVRTPPFFIALFPEELELHLLKLEHDYRGLSEDQIEKTVFAVIPSPGGTYHAQVLSQMPKH